MAEKNKGEQLDDLEKGKKTDSSSMTSEITKERDSTPNEPRPTSEKKESTTPNENSKSEGRTGEGNGESATPTTSKIGQCLPILLGVLGLILLPGLLVVVGLLLLFLMGFLALIVLLNPLLLIVYLIVRVIVAPKKWTTWVVLEWIALVGFTGFLIASLTKQNLKNHLIWELELWKWCILLMVVVCGKLISQWIVNAVFMLICLWFADNLKVYCSAYRLKQKNRVFVWWSLVLIAWLVLVIWFANEGTRSEETKMILDYVTRALASLSIGAGLWLGKDLLLWSIAISFHSKNFFDRILRVNFYKFVIETLQSPSLRSVRERYLRRHGLFKWAEEIEKGKKSIVSIALFIDSLGSDSNYKLKPLLEKGKKDQKKENDAKPSAAEEPEVENDEKDQEKENDAKPSAVNKPELESGKKDQEKENDAKKPELENGKKDPTTTRWTYVLERESKLTDEEKITAPSSERASSGDNWFKVAYQYIIKQYATIIRYVVDSAMDSYLISSFYKTGETSPLTNPEVRMLFKLIGQPPEKVTNFDKLYHIVKEECDSLESSLQNTRRGMNELNRLARGMVIGLILIVWLLMMKVLSTQAVALILSQFVVLAFMFGDSCKRIFEGIIFVFVTNPFDIGDRCLIEGREDEINIQTTIFSRDCPIASQDDNKEKIVYPNSVLATKYICNFHKIPTDSLNFVVDASKFIKPIDTLSGELRDEIRKKYTGTKEIGIKEISVRANSFEDGDKIKMGVYVTYESPWKNNDEKSEWKSKIISVLNQTLEDMGLSHDHPKK